jgi:ABC-type multidrug transport system fused ATPase/permease subunit
MAEPRAQSQTVYALFKPPEQRPLRQLPVLIKASFGLLWQSARREFLLVAALQVLSGAMAGVLLVLVKNLLDAIQSASAAQDFRRVILWLAILAVLTLFTTSAARCSSSSNACSAKT